MYRVYVQDCYGHPLDPTTRFGWVRRALKNNKAKVVSLKPFVIRLNYRIEKPVAHQCVGSTDPGRTNIGNAVLRIDDFAIVYTDKVETRNKEVPKLIAERRAHRQASRRGERLARKRLAKRHNTLSGKLAEGRRLAGCEKVVNVKDIINTESRFSNRKRHANTLDVIKARRGWLTPTAKQLVQTHLNHVDQILKLLPVSGWCLEANKFAFMRMDDDSIYGIDFQNGRLKGFKDPREYVFSLQEGKCACCGDPIYDVHHIVPRSRRGSNTPENLIGLCDDCHHKVHTGEMDINTVGLKQKYAALSVLNQAIPYILEGLIERFGEENVFLCGGWQTAKVRTDYKLEKDHDIDAAAIAAACLHRRPVFGGEDVYSVKQFRRQNRAIINNQRERTYKLDGKTVAKNRKPREEQKGMSLRQWLTHVSDIEGPEKAKSLVGKLTVCKSVRYYNTPKRPMPGTVFIYKGARYVLSGQSSRGLYYKAVGMGTEYFPAAQCRILTRNSGLTYV